MAGATAAATDFVARIEQDRAADYKLALRDAQDQVQQCPSALLSSGAGSTPARS
jgi:hypothetical protein